MLLLVICLKRMSADSEVDIMENKVITNHFREDIMVLGKVNYVHRGFLEL